MKKAILIALIFAGLTTAASAQTSAPANNGKAKTTVTKKHHKVKKHDAKTAQFHKKAMKVNEKTTAVTPSKVVPNNAPAPVKKESTSKVVKHSNSTALHAKKKNSKKHS